MRMNLASRIPSLATLLGAVIAVSGCAAGPGSSVQGDWAASQPAQPYSKVLIVGLSPDADSRCRFERVLARRINSASTAAVASCDVVDRKVPLTRALVEEAVAAKGFDAVLTTKLVSKQWSPKGGGSRDTRGSAGYKATDASVDDVYGYYGGVYSVPVVYGQYQANAESLIMYGQGQVESKLWSVAGPTLVYSMVTSAKNVESTDEGLSLVASTIAEHLGKQGIVR